MEIKIVHEVVDFNRGSNDKVINEYFKFYDGNTILSEIIEDYTCGSIIVHKYYDLSLKRSFFDSRISYIINSEGNVEWNVIAEDTKISDIVRTHNLSDELYVMTFIAEIGGLELIKDVLELWEAVQPLVVDIATALGYLFVFVESFERIGKIFKSKDVSPFNLFDFIYARDYWNHYELSEMIESTVEDTKNLLVVCGYVWNNKKKIYEAKNVELFKEKLRGIDLKSNKPFKG